MSPLVLLITAVGMAVTFLTAIAHKSLVEIAWHELEEYCRSKQKVSVFDDIHDRCDTAIASTDALQTVGIASAILVTASSHAAATLNKVRPPQDGQSLGWSLLVIFGVLALTVWIPREVARFWGSAFLANTWPIWKFVDRLLWPLHRMTGVIRLVTRRLAGKTAESSEEEALEDEILSIVTEGQHDGLLEDDVREMIAGVIELDDSDVADIMTPRSKMDAIPIDMPWSEMLKFVVRVGRTRIPVFGSNLDDVVGLLYVKDLLAFLAEDSSQEPSLAAIMREVRSVPQSTRQDELLQNFLHTRSHLAMVVDEFMHVVGLVTIEDVLEEIVGEIVDESDPEEPSDIRWINEQSAEVMGRAHVEEINEAMGIHLPVSNEYDTIGGFVLHEFGRIPSKGESLKWENLVITIDQATKRRIERLVVSL